ncbi:MAG: ATP-binding protein [Streptosporangiales bacterium]|nr:ATP-binding protein [Streptosporangiales bacterium]
MSLLDEGVGEPTRICVLALPVKPASVYEARAFTAVRLADWDMPELADALGLVVSELVTNAVRHGLPLTLGENDEGFGAQPELSVRLGLLRRGPQVLCAVWDGSDYGPIRRRNDPLAAGGRGLWLVESFSSRWGWVPMRRGGKVVWAITSALGGI